ncbi:MAG: Gfo/Idh/MocA family oxidoreductase, partial [Phycisphaerae bacterium]
MIRLAIVGVGGYGWGLIRELEKAERTCGCRLVAAADTRLPAVPEHAAHLRTRGIALYDDALTMLEDLRGRCEAVYIASGIASHAALTVAAARCGYHVHLEKPPAATVQEVDAMLDALRRADRMCLVGFQALHGDMRLVVDRLCDGRLGA